MFDKQSLLTMYAPKIVPIEVTVDGVSQAFFVKQLSAKKVFSLQDVQRSKGANNQEFALLLISEALCDEDGKPVISREEARALLEVRIDAFNDLVGKIAQAVGLNATPEKTPGKESEVIH
jgi:hypothetical protein